MNQSSLVEDVAAALKSGRITEVELREALSKKPEIKLHETVDLIHTLFCRRPHTSQDGPHNEDGEYCNYYAESILTDGWCRPAHTKWKNATLFLVEAAETSYVGLQKDLRALRAMMVEAWDGKPRNPIVIALYFFINFIGEDEKFFALAKQFIEEAS